MVTATADLAKRWVSIVDDVLQTIPARALIVGLDPDAEDSLEAGDGGLHARRGGSPAVCSGLVTLHARGSVCARVASCIDALCVIDVPTTLVWLGRVHADDLVFGPLAQNADRIILDTSQSSSQGALSDLAHAVRWARGREEPTRPGVAGLAWTRLAPWQEMCARFFDEPRLRELAGRVTRLQMVQASAPGSTLGSEGGLVLGWLATQLGWKAVSLAGKLRLLRSDEGTVRTQLRAEPTHGRLGPSSAIEIDAPSPSLSVHGTIRREPGDADAALWRLEVTGANGETQRLDQRMRLRAGEPARLLERTLHRPAQDRRLAGERREGGGARPARSSFADEALPSLISEVARG